MKAVLNSENPTEAIASAMKMPLFVEMADVCLKIVEPPDDVKPCWFLGAYYYKWDCEAILKEYIICICKYIFIMWVI